MDWVWESTSTVLWTLTLLAFVSATVLPGSSEAALLVVLVQRPELAAPAVWVATAGNTLGGLTSYALGRCVPARVQAAAVSRLQRFGVWALLFSWLPVVGDALCVAAGWLRFHFLTSAVLMALG
ncbi:MAG TPA: DedA family protein, partial [Burkholderiaceae bacterium]|nr:DedA family protein [Burkholderiaceae bacterium]